MSDQVLLSLISAACTVALAALAVQSTAKGGPPINNLGPPSRPIT